MTTIDDIGALSDVPVLAVTDGSAVSHTITSAKKGIILMNVGANLAWYGGSTVNATTPRGVILLPRYMLVFRNVTSDFKVYFQCETSQTTTIGIVEYD